MFIYVAEVTVNVFCVELRIELDLSLTAKKLSSYT